MNDPQQRQDLARERRAREHVKQPHNRRPLLVSLQALQRRRNRRRIAENTRRQLRDWSGAR